MGDRGLRSRITWRSTLAQAAVASLGEAGVGQVRRAALGTRDRKAGERLLSDGAEALLYRAYKAFDSLKRLGFTLDDRWPEEADEVFEALGEYLSPVVRVRREDLLKMFPTHD